MFWDNYALILGGVVIGAVMGIAVSMNWRVYAARSPYKRPYSGKLRHYWEYLTMPTVGWYNRFLLALGLFATATFSESEPWAVLYIAGLWFFLINMAFSAISVSSFRAGCIDQHAEKHIPKMLVQMVKWVENGMADQHAVMVPTDQLIALAEKYHVPMEEVAELMFRDSK